jgi:RND superfamily putative drug exporter
MITVFGSFVLNGDPVIKQFGVGLSVAIFLDATLVRMVIVPATMVLMGRWNWYLPRWLGWLPRIDLPEEAGSEAALAPTQTASEVPS